MSPDERVWFKSSYSAGNGGDCVEVATVHASVCVRDSKQPDGPILNVGSAGWTRFVRMAARG
ncbi:MULTISPECIES: DUF397 domain-containing protein [unclassified Streptomyces]|uniref:DUF397 domain-containing protein n=1 Tax=unclassified Streptomyces TaxID=2593676 RepID=UPI000DAC19A4|nr:MULTISPECIES: DUF397 domain-containing protein [unclassified Streptomyces]PZT72334.1 DUF397 domain-containing protein [Streptomyces sp. AC1-42T]PZT81344.1 DUF397 domain-containing protein [Streptomyces sp. AC1-42W]